MKAYGYVGFFGKVRAATGGYEERKVSSAHDCVICSCGRMDWSRWRWWW